MNLNKNFLKYCEVNDFEINQNQLDIIENLKNYYNNNFHQSFLSKIFKKNNNKLGFYLVGDVGVGKTMILNFFFNELNEKKLRLHFNEFMIEFHNFIFENKNKGNGIELFVEDLSKKTQLIYFDEFQVTNIVDAMILGNLFKKIFDQNIKVIFSSNIKINDLYKDGLQRDQFLPFLKIMKNKCYQEKLNIEEDYRKTKNNNERYIYPINEKNNFFVNKYFRKMTKNKIQKEKILIVKGRKFLIKKYFDGILKFDFKDLCAKNVGAEDYIKIAKFTKFMIVENIPNFNNDNSNQQQRFITLIDILYEKKIPLLLTSQLSLDLLSSSFVLKQAFKRTISRMRELTTIKNIYL